MSLVALSGNTVSITVADHPCTTTTTAVEGCLNVFVGGVAVHYVTGTTLEHPYLKNGDGDCIQTPHIGVLPPNDSTVFVYPGGTPLQIARMGDSYTNCGTLVASQNVTVFAY